MIKINIKKKFEQFCKSKKYERNEKQIEIVNLLEKFLNNKTKSLLFFKIDLSHCEFSPKGLARPEGFEPTTLGLENRCSIQLS